MMAPMAAPAKMFCSGVAQPVSAKAVNTAAIAFIFAPICINYTAL
jgi:hypothetical protein